MPNTNSKFSKIRSLRREPSYIRQARQLTKEVGVTKAISVIFDRARISINTCGSVESWSQAGQAALLVGDHRDCIEIGPLLGVFGSLGREDVHVVAKPFSMSARMVNALGLPARGVILPVIPQTLARDRRAVLNRDLVWRFMNRRALGARHELATLNATTLRRAAHLLELGRLVTIFPAGGVVDALKEPWHRGLGHVVRLLAAHKREVLRIVFFRFDDFSPASVLHRLTLAGRGISPRRPYDLTLHITSSSIEEMLDLAGGADLPDAREIAERFRSTYCRQFSEHQERKHNV
jgi:hypothetical protein